MAETKGFANGLHLNCNEVQQALPPLQPLD